MCVCESVCMCVRFRGFFFRCWRLYVGQFKGVHVWFKSNAYSWKGLCRLYCSAVVRVGTLFLLAKKVLLERGTYIENDFRFLDSGCGCCKITVFLCWSGRLVRYKEILLFGWEIDVWQVSGRGCTGSHGCRHGSFSLIFFNHIWWELGEFIVDL